MSQDPNNPNPTPNSGPSVGGFSLKADVPNNPLESDPNARSSAMLVYILGIVVFLIGPAIFYMMKKDSSPFVAYHAKEVLNWQITCLLASILLCCVGGAIVGPVSLVFMIIGAMAANKGEWFRFPFALRLIK